MTTISPAHRFGVPESADPNALFEMSFLENPARPPNLLLVVALIATGAITYLLYMIKLGDVFTERALNLLIWMYVLATALWVLGKALRPGPRNWLSPDVVFWIVFTMFHMPVLVFYALGMGTLEDNIMHAGQAMNRAVVCVILCMIGFIVGYELGAIGREQPARYLPVRRAPASLFQAAQAMFLVIFVATFLVIALGIGPYILSHGYTGFRRLERFGVSDNLSRLVTISKLILRIGIIVYLASCIMRHRKIVKGLLLPGMLTTAIGFYLVLGARSELAIAGMPVLLGYHYFVKRIRLWLGIPAFLGVLVVFGVVGVGRKTEQLSPTAMMRAYHEYRAEVGVSPFLVSLSEAGGSVGTVNVACAYIPDVEPYWRGRSLLDSLLMIVPNPVAGMRDYISVTVWLTWRATGRVGGEQAGKGGSIAAEAYMNFGLLGAGAFLAVVGFMMRWIYDTVLRRPTFLSICVLLISVTGLALWCRNSSHQFLRPVVWTAGMAWVLGSVLGGGSEPVPSYGPARARG